VGATGASPSKRMAGIFNAVLRTARFTFLTMGVFAAAFTTSLVARRTFFAALFTSAIGSFAGAAFLRRTDFGFAEDFASALPEGIDAALETLPALDELFFPEALDFCGDFFFSGFIRALSEESQHDR